jgi:dimethylargininase
MFNAITRAVSTSIQECQLTHLARVPIDYAKADQQHRAYEAVLTALGVRVQSLPAEPRLPDSVFVEDTAVVVDECAIITRPGAESRRSEVHAIAAALAPYRQCLPVQPPGELDGGDVLRVGRRIYIGRSTRSNEIAVSQMRACLEPFGYHFQVVEIAACLHLKSAVTQVAPDTLLINPTWVARSEFAGMNCIDVDPSEPSAANALLIGETVVYQPAYPRTYERLERAGLRVVPADTSELAKAEGALTCCSIVFTQP